MNTYVVTLFTNCRTMMRAGIIFSLILLFIAIACLPATFAQELSLSISPPLVETVIKPGKSILIAYTIQNYADPTVLKIKVRPFLPKNNVGEISIKKDFSGPVRFQLDNNDIELEKPFFLKPNEKKQALVRLRIPDGAPEGDYYYTILAETEAPPALEGSSTTSVMGAIGANLLVSVSETGYSPIQAKIVLFDLRNGWKMPFINSRIFDSSSTIPVVLIVGNAGKHFVKPEGKITLRGNFGETANYDIVPQNILAESQRLTVATPSATIDCDNSTACTYPASLNLSGFFIGKYNLKASVGFGGGSQQLYANASFIALPIKAGIALGAAIIIAVAVIKKFKKQ